jgi:hypothetical protein
MHQAGEVVELEAHIGVEQGFIPFTAAPEHITGTTEFDGEVERLLDLTRGEREDIRAGSGAGAMREAGIAEEVCGAQSTFLLYFLLSSRSRSESRPDGLGLAAKSLPAHVTVMETVVLDATVISSNA